MVAKRLSSKDNSPKTPGGSKRGKSSRPRALCNREAQDACRVDRLFAEFEPPYTVLRLQTAFPGFGNLFAPRELVLDCERSGRLGEPRSKDK
jgi:hypothetical protein